MLINIDCIIIVNNNDETSINYARADYTGVPLQDIYEHLKDWRNSTNELLHNLNEHKAKAIQYKEQIDRVNVIISFIDGSIDLFSRFLSDFDRLIAEIPDQVTAPHIEIISQILRRSELHEQSCVLFKQDHIEKSIRDESMRPLLDAIYADTRDEIVDYSDLSNVIPRLKTYIGSGLRNNEHGVSDDALDALELKPNIFGIGFHLNYLIKRVKQRFKKKSKK